MKEPKRNLPRNEWDFSRVPDEELYACLVYEYARESAYIRDVYTRCHESSRSGVGDPDGALNRELLKIQTIHPFEDVFLQGFTYPKPHEPQGERHEFAPPLTSCFPNPWQTIGDKERKYRAFIRHWYDELAPLERAHWSDAKEILRLAENWQRCVFGYEQEHGYKPGTRDAACKHYGLPLVPPASFYCNGETLLFSIRWDLFTNDQLTSAFREWVKRNRPPQHPPPDNRGRKPKDLRAALKRLGIMRLLHTFTVAEMPHRCPEAAALIVEPDCYKERKKALPLLRKFFPFLPETDKPLSWPTHGGRARSTPETPRHLKTTE